MECNCLAADCASPTCLCTGVLALAHACVSAVAGSTSKQGCLHCGLRLRCSTHFHAHGMKMAGKVAGAGVRHRRPTYFPSSRLQPRLSGAASQDTTARFLAGYVATLTDLAAPKAALPLLHDPVRLGGFQAGMQAALQGLPGDQGFRAQA